jgi:ribosomal protein S18 acetylase RimI-like enzyme
VPIRPATLDDVEAIVRMHTRAWHVAYRGILPETVLERLDAQLPERIERRRAFFEHEMGPEQRWWVLDGDAASLVGWAATGPARDEDLGEEVHELYAIYLEADKVGQGHGRALMTHCLDDVRTRGFLEMVMWVLDGNERAQAFYRAAGFEPDPRVEPTQFEDTGANKLRMRRDV